MPKHSVRFPSAVKPITLAIIASLASLALAAPPAPTELPTGGQVTAGSAAITQSAANLTINQASSRAVINWNTFNIGSQASVVFNQPGPSAVALNRVLSSDPSSIYGRLSATGQIFLINPAGVVFGPGASVNTAAIVASTLSLSDQNFMAGNYRFERNGSTGAILNQGTIASDKGFVALLAPEVRNEGVVRANLGTVAFAAGDAVTLTFDASNALKVAVQPSTIKTLLENRHIIQADGGTVLMASSAAADVLGSVIRNTGVIEANTIGSINGEVVVYAANGATTLEGTGRVAARGAADGQSGGTVKLLGDKVGMFDSSSIDASGAAGGGTVLVGGGYQGKNPEFLNANRTYIGPDATITADALTSGDGGKVIVWADNATGFYGAISARGGARGGDGGLVETSGKQFLIAEGRVDASAPEGTGGQWLLDPFNVTVSNNPDINPNVWAGNFSATATGSNANATTIQNALNTGTSVTISTGAVGGETGNITVSGTADAGGAVNIIKTGGGNASLTLQAAGSIFVNSGANISSNSGALNVTLNSRNDNGTATAAGAILINNASILSNGGNITLGGGLTPLTTPAIGTLANVEGIRLLPGTTLSSGAGNISLRGQGVNGSSFADGVHSAAKIQSTTGAINITGDGGLFATGAANNGINMDNANSGVNTVDGAITLTGKGGSTAGPGGFNRGIQVQLGPVIQSTGAGTITLIGNGGTSVDNSGQNSGILISGAAGTKISAVNGAISLTGKGGTVTGAVLNTGGSPGISIQNGPVVESTGTATITLNGTGGTLVNGSFNQGINLNGNGGTRISSVNGAINITGTGGTTTGTGGINRGITMFNGAVVESTGNAPITIIGTAGTSVDTGANEGIQISQAGTVVRTVSGAISLTGTGNGGATQNHGVEFLQGAAVTSTGAATISITGVANSTGTGLEASFAPNVSLGGALDSGNINLTADSMNFPNANVRTTGTVSINTITANRNITVGGAAGTASPTALVIDSAEIAQINATNLNIGNATNAQLNTGGVAIATTANLTLAGNALAFSDNISTTGNLVLTAPGGITQTAGALTVNGTSTFNAGASPVTLNNALNDFIGAVTVTGSTVDIRDQNQLTVAVNATGAVSVRGNLTYSGTSGNLTLTATATPVGTLSFGNTVVNGNLVATADDAVSQLAGTSLTVTGTTNIDASANNKSITLFNPGNDFGGVATFRGSTIQIADATALNAVLNGTGAALLSPAGALTVSGNAVGVIGNAGTSVTVAAAGLNGGAGAVQLRGPGDLTLNGIVQSAAGGDAVVMASTAGNFINNVGATVVNVPLGRFLIYSGAPVLDIINGLAAPNSQFSTFFGDPVGFATSGFLYRNPVGFTVPSVTQITTSSTAPAQALQAVDQSAGQKQESSVLAPASVSNNKANPDTVESSEPLVTVHALRVGSVVADTGVIDSCWTATTDPNGQPCETVRRAARKARYNSAIEVIRRVPTVADIPLCSPGSSEVCMPAKPGIVEDAALGQPQLVIPPNDVRRKVAVLFGNNDYTGEIPALVTPAQDVTAIGKVLQERFGYEVTVIKNASKADMVRALKNISERSEQDESVLVFYAGHGYQMDESKAGFWLPTDATASDPRTWLSNNDIQRFLNRIDAKQIIVISDSCFSGTLTKEQTVDAPRTAPREQLLSRRAVVTFSSGDEEPVSDDGLEGHSIFAYHFINEIQQIRKYSPVTVAFDRIREKVAQAYPQTPQLGSVISAGHMSGASYLFEVK